MESEWSHSRRGEWQLAAADLDLESGSSLASAEQPRTRRWEVSRRRCDKSQWHGSGREDQSHERMKLSCLGNV
jgi:hypothetical protein